MAYYSAFHQSNPSGSTIWESRKLSIIGEGLGYLLGPGESVIYGFEFFERLFVQVGFLIQVDKLRSRETPRLRFVR